MDFLKLAGPMVLNGLLVLGMGLINTVFVGHVSQQALAAVAVASAVYSVISQILAASTLGYQVLVARLFGAKQEHQVESYFLSGFLLSFPFALLGVVVLWFSKPILQMITSSTAVVDDAVTYLRFLSPALLLSVPYSMLQATLNAAKKSLHSFYTTLVVLVVALPLNYGLIFGIGPVPPLEILGAALATLFATLIGTGVLLFQGVTLLSLQWKRGHWDRLLFFRMMGLSSPEMVNAFLDYMGNLAFVAIIGRLGTESLAGNRIAFQVLLILFAVAMGLGGGVRILVGHNLGQGNRQKMKRTVTVGRNISLGILVLASLPLVFFPKEIAGLLSPLSEVSGAATAALLLIAFTAPWMSWATTYVSALRAQGYTGVTTVINIGAIWLVQLPVAWWSTQSGYGLAGAYYGLLAYFLVRAVCSHLLFSRYQFIHHPPPQAAVADGDFLNAQS